MVGVIEGVGQEVRELAVGQCVFVAIPDDELGAVPQRQVYAVPEGEADEQAVFTSLCEIGLHALRRGSPSLGENVAIIGQGIVGLATLAVARAWGLRTIALDLDERRLAFARAMGADLVLSPAEPDYEERIAAFSGPEGV